MQRATSTEPIFQGLDLFKLPHESWRPFEAENQRKAERIGEREFEKIPVWIRSDKYREWVPVRIRDFSVLGFGIQYEHVPGMIFSALEGDAVELKIRLHSEKESVIPCLLQNLGLPGKGLRYGLRRKDLRSQEAAAKGITERHLVNRELPLSVRIENPFLYDEWAEAGLIGFGPGNEWILESFDSALLLLKGLDLRFFIQLPMENGGLCSGEVLWMSAAEGDRLLFAVRWSNVSFDLGNAMGEFLMQFWGAKPSELPGYGIHLKRFKEQLRFQFVSTQDEYEKVLQLRRNAYVRAGKQDPDAPAERFSSLSDTRSRILAAFHQETLVASMTLAFPTKDTRMLRSEAQFPEGKCPVKIPPKDKLIEVHSFCTHKDFRGGDLVQGMVEHALRCLILSDREWAITMTTRELLPLYERFGFKRTGASAKVASLNGLEHFLVLLDRNAVIHGAGINPLNWEYFYGDLMRDLLGKKLLEIPFWRRSVLFIHSLLGGFSKAFIKRSLERDFLSKAGRTETKET